MVKSLEGRPVFAGIPDGIDTDGYIFVMGFFHTYEHTCKMLKNEIASVIDVLYHDV